MNYAQMDRKRDIDPTNVPINGHVVCKCGRFSIVLVKDGSFSMVDASTGYIIDHVTSSDFKDLSEASSTIEEWTSFHHVAVKKAK